MKSYGDTLVAIGHQLTDCELTSYILAGIGFEYDPIITSLTTWPYLMNFQKIYGHLMHYKFSIEQHDTSFDLNNVNVNTTTRHNGNNRGKSQGSNSGSNTCRNSSYQPARRLGLGRGQATYIDSHTIC